MSEIFSVDSSIVAIEPLPPTTQVVFHAINKSGSEALSNLLFEAFRLNGRSSEFHSHFRIPVTQEQFIDYVNARRSDRGFFIDHYMYGSVRPWPNRTYLTQFRHPLSRLLSAYNWLKKIAERENSSFPEFKSFVEESNGVYHSIVVQLGTNWHLFDTPDWRQRIEKLGAEGLYERSVEALEREIYAIGIAEYFEESIFLYASLLRLAQVPPWQRDKRNEDRPLSTEIDREVIELVEHINRWDYALYALAQRRFHAQFIAPQASTALKVYKDRCRGEYRDRLTLEVSD